MYILYNLLIHNLLIPFYLILKKSIKKGKGSFINENALMKVLYLRIQDLQKNWSKGISNWARIQNELAMLFGNRFLKYIERE